VNTTELEQALIKHDWYFEYSDDLRVFKRGHEQKAQIIVELNKLSNVDALAMVLKRA
jgi:hypothetical protein